MAKKTVSERILRCEALVNNLNEGASFARVNCLRKELQWQRRNIRDDGFAQHLVEEMISSLPAPKTPAQKYAYEQWTDFRLWQAEVLRKEGISPVIGRADLATFNRVANPEQLARMKELLS